MSGMTPTQKRRASITAAIVVAVVVGMTGMAFAAVPLYDLFCKVTGYGGTPQTAAAAPTTLGRPIEVRFDTNVAPGLPLEFSPPAAQHLRLGESGLAFFRLRNTSDHPVAAFAGFNVTPHKAGRYFNKIQCFCFKDQVLEPGQEMELPVVYFVDPELAQDPDGQDVNTITLSYTFFHNADAAAAALEVEAGVAGAE